VTLTIQLVTGSGKRSILVTTAGFASLSACKVEVTHSTSITVFAIHVLQTWTLAGLWMTDAVLRWVCTFRVTGTGSTGSVFGVSIETRHTLLTISSCSVEQAVETVAVDGVAFSNSKRVNVAMTITFFARASSNDRISVITVVTLLTLLPEVSRQAVDTNDVSVGVRFAGLSKLVASTSTWALAALTVVGGSSGSVTIISVGTPVTPGACSIVQTVGANTRYWITGVGMAGTFTG
jgi:hypothetical protein